MNRSYTLTSIGTVRSPHLECEGMPIQPLGARGFRGAIELDPMYEPGLADLTGFSRVIVLYLFHRSTGYSLSVTPFLDTRPRGLFATRAPRRPNPIGLSVLRLTGVEGCRLLVEDVDILDGTPVLDIKPYVPLFDAFPGEASGWFGEACRDPAAVRADRRFVGEDGTESSDA